MIVKQIIRLTNNWIMDGTLEDNMRTWTRSVCKCGTNCAITNYRHSLRYMRIVKQERRTSLKECLTPVEQAACAFCIQFFKQQDLLEILMEDLDFMMVAHSKHMENKMIVEFVKDKETKSKIRYTAKGEVSMQHLR